MDFSFCPVLDEMLRTRRAVGQSGRVFEPIEAVSTVNNLHVLRQLMLERRPARTLEVGLAFGGSALTIAATHRELGAAAAGQHIAIDPYQYLCDHAALVALQRAQLSGYVELREQLSSLALGALTAADARFGLIYVDGSHVFENVFIDAYFGFRLLTDDGVILFDDCTIDHVTKVLSFVSANWASFTEEVDLSGYRSDGNSLRYRAGRRLGKIQLRAFRRTGPDQRPWDVPLNNF